MMIMKRNYDDDKEHYVLGRGYAPSYDNCLVCLFVAEVACNE